MADNVVLRTAAAAAAGVAAIARGVTAAAPPVSKSQRAFRVVVGFLLPRVHSSGVRCAVGWFLFEMDSWV